MKNPDMNVALTIPVNMIEKNSAVDEDDDYLEQDAPMKPLEKFYSALLLLSDKSQ
jgi:hypothetical protein